MTCHTIGEDEYQPIIAEIDAVVSNLSELVAMMDGHPTVVSYANTLTWQLGIIRNQVRASLALPCPDCAEARELFPDPE